jgi:transcription antitermination factor NusG
VIDSLDTLFLPESPGLWHLIHTRSRQEKALAETLDARGIRYFLPLMTHHRTYGTRKAQVEVPMFPGYLFLKGSLEEAYEADRTDRVAQIIPVHDQGKLAWELRNLARAMIEKVPLDPFPFLKRGVRVEVRSGPLKGLQGVVEIRGKRDRLVLQVEALGQATSLEIDAELLQPIDNA